MVDAKSTPSNRESISTAACGCEDRAHLALSHAVLSLLSALSDDVRSFLCFMRNSLQKCSISRWSKSSPPRCVSPAVAFTSNTASSMVSSDTSNVPPPRSKISTLISPLLLTFSSPYEMAAAVGSLMMRSTVMPLILPASCVALRWASLK